jgi:hypothetical protein
MYPVSELGLRFNKIPVITHSSRGIPYTRWVDTGMPVVPKEFRDCVFYLYKSREDAEQHKPAGGTGFLVAIPTEDGLGHHYGVTNWHVAVRDGFSVIRLNTRSGGTEILEFDPSDWVFESKKNDVAIVPLDIRDSSQKAYFIGTQFFLTEENAGSEEIGPGENVFMVGRFMDIDDRAANNPLLRFGNISSQPIKMKQPTGYEDGECYCIDMHSRSGYSGSPVFAYRTSGDDLRWIVTGDPMVLAGNALAVLLGIHWGQFTENLPIEKRRNTDSESANSQYKEYVKGLSGMTCVIPAWEIMNILNCETLMEQRKQVEIMRKKKASPSFSEPIAESHDSGISGDDILRTMLNTPHKPQTTPKAKPKQKRAH